MRTPPAGQLRALGAAFKLATNWSRYPALACLRKEPAGGEVWAELALLHLRWRGPYGRVHAIAIWASINDEESEVPALFVTLTLPEMRDSKEDPTLRELCELLESFWVAPLPYPGEG